MALLGLAIRNLGRNRRRSALTLSAIVLDVVVMIGMRGWLNAQQDMLLGNLVQGRLGAVQVHRAGYVKNVLANPISLDLEDTAALRATLSSVPNVTAVAPRIEFGAMISGPEAADVAGRTAFFMATAVDPRAEAQVTPLRHEMIARGRMPPGADDPEVVLNAAFAKGLGLTVHDARDPLPPPELQLALLAADRDGALNGESVVLGGTAPSFTAEDRRVGLVPLRVAQRLLRMEGRVTEYALAVEPLSAAGQVKAELAARLGPRYEVHTWIDLYPFATKLFATQDLFFAMGAAVFLAVVLLGILNAMLMTVLERTREIGTMLAVGMRRAQIVRLFVLEGAVLGLAGTAIGLSFAAAAVAYAHHHGIPVPAAGSVAPSILRPTVSAQLLASTFVAVPLFTALAALWPARHAARLSPIHALQAT